MRNSGIRRSKGDSAAFLAVLREWGRQLRKMAEHYCSPPIYIAFCLFLALFKFKSVGGRLVRSRSGSAMAKMVFVALNGNCEVIGYGDASRSTPSDVQDLYAVDSSVQSFLE